LRNPTGAIWKRVIVIVVVATLILSIGDLLLPFKAQPLATALVFPITAALLIGELWAWLQREFRLGEPLFQPRGFVALILIFSVIFIVGSAADNFSSDAALEIRNGHRTDIGWLAPFVRTALPVRVDETTRTAAETPEPTDAEACSVLLATNGGYSIMWNVTAERTEAIPSGEIRLIAVPECEPP
jgi:hypothetical protein